VRSGKLVVESNGFGERLKFGSRCTLKRGFCPVVDMELGMFADIEHGGFSAVELCRLPYRFLRYCSCSSFSIFSCSQNVANLCSMFWYSALLASSDAVYTSCNISSMSWLRLCSKISNFSVTNLSMDCFNVLIDSFIMDVVSCCVVCLRCSFIIFCHD
jgi:hypothetical protein